jgi:hypothetical protein
MARPPRIEVGVSVTKSHSLVHDSIPIIYEQAGVTAPPLRECDPWDPALDSCLLDPQQLQGGAST